MLDGYPQNITITGRVNPVTGQMEYEQTPPLVGGIGNPNPATVTYDVSYAANSYAQGVSMFTPFPNHTTDMAASIYSPCSIVNCPNRANPVNAVEANLNVFGDPAVRVHLCDDHYKLFGDATTGEHEAVADNEKPDIVEEQA